MEKRIEEAIVGLDVGSTTVKCVVMNKDKEILWKDYKRHETRQAELVLEFLEKIKEEVCEDLRIFVTGSGGGTVTPYIGGRFVQEVNAVIMAVEELHGEDAGSVIELGGQDAKVVIWKEDPKTKKRQLFASMNDKCAGGTGATIDKIVAKVGISNEELSKIHFDDTKLHSIAAKCGVFAETDVVNLLKASIPAEDIMISLADAIIRQNLSVLMRGNLLRDKVVLLGGPNTFLKFLLEGWQQRIKEVWEERKWVPKTIDGGRLLADVMDELVIVPENSQYYAAYGCGVYGLGEKEEVGRNKGLTELREYIEKGRQDRLMQGGAAPGLVGNAAEYKTFIEEYEIPKFRGYNYRRGEVVEGYIGLDGGSTSTKAVLMNKDKEIISKVYQLSNGNPIEDTKQILKQLSKEVEGEGCKLEIKGFGATGYAADVLEKTMLCDVNLVETVAHMKSSVHYFGEVDVIVDVGGQDIKVLFMEHGRVKDFKLNTQCSAGNGYFLQSMAQQFGIDIRKYADYAFKAKIAPIFNYGCAVFMEQDKVNFQQQGWSKEELMAGLALVLPLNIWQYVVQEPNLQKYGTRFVLQGGTQYNLAAVKAQVDYIKEKVPNAQVMTHPHTGEAGAIGACIEAIEVVEKKGGKTSFVGLDEVIKITYETKTSEETKCTFCSNNCSRTFIDTKTPNGFNVRYISGFSCDKGMFENKEALKVYSANNIELKKKYPNLVDYESKLAFKSFDVKRLYSDESLEGIEADIEEGIKEKSLSTERVNNLEGRVRNEEEVKISRKKAYLARQKLRIGIPRVLNSYSTAPFWTSYLEALGIRSENIIYSDYTSEELWSHGSKWGSVDPCFPSKVTNAHIHNLLYKKSRANKPLDMIFFPIIINLQTQLVNTQNNMACPVVSGSPEVVKSSFTKEKDVFDEKGIKYVNPSYAMSEPYLFQSQLYESFKEILDITEEESDFAYKEGANALKKFNDLMKEKGRILLENLSNDGRVGILMIGRPYHNDPGLNHGILESLQLTGIPVLSMRSLPTGDDILKEVFKKDLEAGVINNPMDVTDVWKNCYSENSSMKIWAAKFAARHPNIVVVDLSNFKCGHDAPIYTVIENILEATKTPHFTFHDIDENKPSGSIKIRTKTVKYFLEQYEETLKRHNEREGDLKELLDRKYEELAREWEMMVREGAVAGDKERVCI